MRRPSVVHLKSLDTLGLRGAAQAIGSGHAGVRLTREGLTIYVRESRRALEAPPSAPAPAMDATPARETLVPCVAPAAPPESAEPIAPGELSFRAPTIWAVAFLTLGVSFGAAIARVVAQVAPSSSAANAPALAAPPVAEAVTQEGAAVAWPRAARGEAVAPVAAAETPTVVTSVFTISARRHRHAAVADAQAPTDTAAASPPGEAEGASEDRQAAASSEQARRELQDAL